MKQIKIANTDMEVSQISLGCMRIASLTNNEVETLVNIALEEGD